jgi:hypothetical protein
MSFKTSRSCGAHYGLESLYFEGFCVTSLVLVANVVPTYEHTYFAVLTVTITNIHHLYPEAGIFHFRKIKIHILPEFSTHAKYQWY